MNSASEEFDGRHPGTVCANRKFIGRNFPAIQRAFDLMMRAADEGWGLLMFSFESAGLVS